MARNRTTITDYLAATEEPIDELWHQQLLDEMRWAIEELEPQMGADDDANV